MDSDSAEAPRRDRCRMIEALRAEGLGAAGDDRRGSRRHRDVVLGAGVTVTSLDEWPAWLAVTVYTPAVVDPHARCRTIHRS